jgi:hypothetical protein
MNIHRTQYEANPTGSGCCRSYILFQKAREIEGEIKIELLEEFPCESKEQLRERERHHISNSENVLNKKIPGRSKEEYSKSYYQENRRKIQVLNLGYYYKHKEECLKRNREYRQNLRSRGRGENILPNPTISQEEC